MPEKRGDPILKSMITELTLPGGEKVQLIFLRQAPDLGELIYLQSIRSRAVDENSTIATIYRGLLLRFTMLLAGEAKAQIQFDTVISPPSSRNDADPYREAVLRQARVPDLSSRFSRNGSTRSATATSLEEMCAEFEYKAGGDEASIKSLLIVDESVASGRTIAAMLCHLRKAGLPRDCVITVAAPAFLQDRRSK